MSQHRASTPPRASTPTARPASSVPPRMPPPRYGGSYTPSPRGTKPPPKQGKPWLWMALALVITAVLLVVLLLVPKAEKIPEPIVCPTSTAGPTATMRPTAIPTPTATVAATTLPPTPSPTPVPTAEPAKDLQVLFFDVGDADAALVSCGGHHLLIDGGTRNSSRLLYTYLKEHGIARVDGVIVTHPHSDHAGGLSGALSYEGCTFGALYTPVRDSDNSSFQTLLTKAAQRAVPLVIPDVGDSFPLGGATVTFLSPPREKSYENVNNKSLVVRIDFRQVSFLFTGDAMENAELDMVQSGQNLSATVLKVGHHGANTSTTAAFLEAVSPRVAVISCGANHRSHPHPEVVSRLEGANCQILRTDQEGSICLSTDGVRLYRVKTE